MTDNDTIAAVVTPPGAGGLGVIRLSGPEAFLIADGLFRGKRPLADEASHTLHHGLIHDNGHPVDDGVAALFRGPRSYTGEDVVEVSCHGSMPLLKRVMDLCLARGARPAGPGEFTQRAYLNGKMDLAQAEAVAALIAARSEDGRRWALAQLRGDLSRLVEKLRGEAVSLLAHLEAALDFVDDEVPSLSRAGLVERLAALSAGAADLLKTAPRGRLHRDGFRAALVGKPNAGKSSLFNALLGTDRAIVTPLPGTTRDTLEESFSADGLPVVITDTAGLRESADAAEEAGMARARTAAREADLRLWVVDAADAEIPGPPLQFPGILVLTKADLLTPSIDRIPLLGKARRAQGAPPACPAVFVSAVTGEGLVDLRREIRRAAGEPGTERETAEGPTLILARHEAALGEASRAFARALEGARGTSPDEALAVDLRQAADVLGLITGRGVAEDVMEAVFSQFCIGK